MTNTESYGDIQKQDRSVLQQYFGLLSGQKVDYNELARIFMKKIKRDDGFAFLVSI